MTEEYVLNEKQKMALDFMIGGFNVFITGPGGTGKSLLIHLFKNQVQHTRTVAITSTTGISALQIGGTTLHSYLGIGLGQGSAETIAERVGYNPKARQRWQQLDTLIIDEVSMLSSELFDKLDIVGRYIRYGKSFLQRDWHKPFGGLQIILAGDFLQLPVVENNDSFCFEAKSWPNTIQKSIHLTEVMRQKNVQFQQILAEIRLGTVSTEAKKLLNSRLKVKLNNDLGIKPTRIYTTNAIVDHVNETELDNLARQNENLEFYEYEMTVNFSDQNVKNKNELAERYRKSCLAPEKLQLCIGAQVMLLCNLDLEAGLANGSRGVITNFIEGSPQVKFLNSQERIISTYSWLVEEGNQPLLKITQVPLKPCWAITVHKSQGSTLDYAEIDLTNVFTYGQAYVALSRVRNLEGLSLLGIDFSCIRAHPKALQYYNQLDRQTT